MAPDADSDAKTVDATQVTPPALSKDEKELDQLALCYYLLALLTLLSALPMIPYALSAWEIAHWVGQPPISDRATKLLRWVRFLPGMNRPEYDDQMLGITLVLAIIPTLALMVVHSAVLVGVGRWLARRRRYKTTFVFALFHLTNLPTGTALSIMTLMLLKRPAVKQLYNPQPTPSETEPGS